MTASLWQAHWFGQAKPARRKLWRGVEAQHRVATMRLVDNLAEQELLEQLIEGSKPALPLGTQGLHYLISTPFRYTSPYPSRYRPANEPGIWYGAEEPETVAAELAYWRWKFLVESDGLRENQLVTEHTFFQALFRGVELDLTVPPWRRLRGVLRDGEDYSACHELARQVRERSNPAIAALHYDFQPFRRLVGFSGSVRLGEIGQLQDDRTPAFRVRFLQGSPPYALRWRGVALGDFNGSAWTNSAESWTESLEQGKIMLASDEQRRKPGERLFFEVQTLASMDRVLFSVGVPEYVYLPKGRLRWNGEGSLRQLALDNSLPLYSLSGWIGQSESHPTSSDATAVLSNDSRQRYTRLLYMHPRIRELAQDVAGSTLQPYEIALRIENHLRASYGYTLESKIGGREPLIDFLFVTRAGHCEYFASAMAVMLRTMRIPARVVTGFYSTLPEPVDNWYVIRSSSAHSWVEVWIEGRGWVVFDPTPPGSNQPKLSAAMQWFVRMQDRFVVMSEEWMGGAAGLKRPAMPHVDVEWRWLGVPVIVALLWGLWRLRPLQRDARHEATELYWRYLKASKAERLAGQTAREIGYNEIVSAYERARFARDTVALGTLKRLVAEFVEKRV